MEIRLEAADGCKMPAGSFLAVKLGDVLKQGRYEPSRTYQFAKADRRRHAKIDLFKHVGSSVVLVSPDAGPNISEVCITSGDPLIEDLRLKVDVKLQMSQKNKAAEPVKQAVRTHAQTYLSKHGIEEKLSNCVKLLLQQQPDDPIEFVCCHLRGTPYPPPVMSMPQQDSATSSAIPAGEAAHQAQQPSKEKESSNLAVAVADSRKDSARAGSKHSQLDQSADAKTSSPELPQASKKASLPSSSLDESQAASAEAPDSPSAAVQQALTQARNASSDGVPLSALRLQMTEEREIGLTFMLQKLLVDATKDGRLLKELQAKAPMAAADTKQSRASGFDGSAGRVVMTAAERAADPASGYDLGVLRMEAAMSFAQATRDGRLQTVLTEIAKDGGMAETEEAA